jgi:hypothetical protein
VRESSWQHGHLGDPMPSWEYAHMARSLQSRRDIDTAKGVVMVLRHCSAEAAFGELVRVAQRYTVALSTVASALVDLAGGRGQGRSDTAGPAHAAAQQEWGEVLRRVLALRLDR